MKRTEEISRKGGKRVVGWKREIRGGGEREREDIQVSLSTINLYYYRTSHWPFASPPFFFLLAVSQKPAFMEEGGNPSWLNGLLEVVRNPEAHKQHIYAQV